MNPFKFKHIVIGLVIAFILFLFYRAREVDYSYDQTGIQPRFQATGPNGANESESESEYPYSSTRSPNPSNLTRHEVLQTKVKGYREETYWGEETSIDEKVKYMNDDEFDRFIEETEQKDADLFWGAEY